MILEPSLPFMSFSLEELSETDRRSGRFLWKSQLSGGISGIRRFPAPVNAIAGRAEGLSSIGTTSTWDHEIGSSAITARRRYGSAGRSIKEDLGWADREAGYVVRL